MAGVTMRKVEPAATPASVWLSRKTTAVTMIVCLLLALSGCGGNATKGDERVDNTIRKETPEFSSVPSQPTDTAQTLALAEAAYASKDWQAAEQNYVIITRAIPKESTPWFRLGNIYARTNRPDFAVRAYKEALLRDPGLSKAWYNMGLVQLRQSANSFLQMRTHTEEQSEAQIRAETMYEATIGLIKDGPKRVRSYSYEEAPSAVSPVITDLSQPLPNTLPAEPSTIEQNSSNNDSESQPITEPTVEEGTQNDDDIKEAAQQTSGGQLESILKEQESEAQADDQADDLEQVIKPATPVSEQTSVQQAAPESTETSTANPRALDENVPQVEDSE